MNSKEKSRQDESELVHRIRAGDETAFSEVVGMFKEKLFRLAYGITLDREESQDIVQDVFLKAFQAIDTFKGQSSLATWLHRITVNHCLNWKRRLSRRFKWRHQPLEADEGVEQPELATEADNPDRQYGEKEFLDLFEKHFKSLPEEARAVFILKELEGHSYEEIAAQLGLKVGTVSSRLFYARQRLKDAMTPYLSQPETGSSAKGLSLSGTKNKKRER